MLDYTSSGLASYTDRGPYLTWSDSALTEGQKRVSSSGLYSAYLDDAGRLTVARNNKVLWQRASSK